VWRVAISKLFSVIGQLIKILRISPAMPPRRISVKVVEFVANEKINVFKSAVKIQISYLTTKWVHYYE
jgi:hypothetical protein